MAVKTDNVFINNAKTYKVERLLPGRDTAIGWQVAHVAASTQALTAYDGVVPRWNFPGMNGASGNSTIELNLKSSKAGEAQYRATVSDGLSSAACVKVGCKNVPDVYNYSVLSPEKLQSKIPGVQVLVSLEELFRASRITKVNPASGSTPETYECNDVTGHLPITGWICIRLPKHPGMTEDVLQAYICDLLGTLTTRATDAKVSLSSTIYEVAQGDVLL